MDALDGNAIAGDLFTAFGREMTPAIGRCNDCGARSVVAELRVYVSGPGAVAQCPHCGTVAIVVARGSALLAAYTLTEP